MPIQIVSNFLHFVSSPKFVCIGDRNIPASFYIFLENVLKHCITILFAAYCCLSSNAQSYYFRHYQVEEGLSHNTVYCTIQDEQGFMWFGTKDGLNRFDGYNFKTFRHQPGDSSSLNHNFVYSLYIDRQQTMWVGTARGLFEYIRSSETFRQVPVNSAGDLYDIRGDQQGRIWFLMDGYLYCYDRKHTKAQRFSLATHHPITALYIDSDNKIWYSTYSTLNCYNPSDSSIQSFNLFQHSPYTVAQWVRRIIPGPGNSLLIGTNDQGLKLFNTLDGGYTDLLTQNQDKTNIFVRDIVETRPGEYWIGTESGVFIYDLTENSFTNLKKSFTNPYSLSDNAVYTICKDREGGVWIGTYFGGLNYYRKQYNPFEKFFPDNSERTISGNAVREICEDDRGHLWIATEDRGLNRYNKKTGVFTHYLPGPGKHNLSYYNIHGLLYTDGYLWIGTFEHGIDIMDTRSGKIVKHFDNSLPAIRSNFFVSFYKTSSGQILAANTSDLIAYIPAKDSFAKVEEIPGNNFVHHIMEDREGNIWVSTFNNGLYYYNPHTQQKGQFLHNPGDKNSISGNVINSSFEDSKGYIWIATDGNGLCRYDKKSKQFKRYTVANGLPANFIFKVLEDNGGQLWISTTRGLVCMNPETEKMRLYTVSNGILNDQFNYNSGYKDASGRMYFGSVKGMISFDPQRFIPDNYRPPVFITGLQIHNREFIPKNNQGQTQSILATQQVRLSYNESSISIDFAGLSYTAPEMIRYTYILQGLQTEWTDLSSNRKAYFTDLSPGLYVFMVKAAGANGEWSTPASITIEILPPWWQTRTAYLIYVLTLLGLCYWIASFLYQRARARTRRRMEQLAHEKEKELYEAKIDFFTQVAHEIKTPLTLIKAPLEKISGQLADNPAVQKNLRSMEKNTHRLIDLTNQLLDFRLTEARGYSLNFSLINVSLLVSETFNDFKPIAEQKKLAFTLQVPQTEIWAQADADALEKIFANLFSNAVKYADTVITVNLQQSNEMFVLSLFNDGYIIPEEKSENIFEPFYRIRNSDKQKGTGIGLALSRSLTLLHRGTLTLENTPTRKGNSFVLRIPLKPSDNSVPLT